MVMRKGVEVVEFLLVVPTQKRHVGEDLISVVSVSSILIDAHLQSILSV